MQAEAASTKSTSSSSSLSETLPPNKTPHTPATIRRGAQVRADDGSNLVVRGEIGAGSFGTVLLCEKVDGEHGDVALKVLKNDKGKDVIDAGKKEEAILREAEHPNVVKVHSSWENKGGYHLAMEYAARGDAFDIVDFYNGGCPEPLAGKVALGLFSALAHIHSKGIVHRDVKPENLFIKDDGDVVLGDFGLAGRKKSEAELLRTPCGTMTYRAPEIVKGEKYGPGVDVWSAGLTIYTLLTGYDPWATAGAKMSPAMISKKILAGQLNRYPSHVSTAAKDFIARCCELDSKKRMTAAAALEHPWMRIATVFVEADLPKGIGANNKSAVPVGSRRQL